MGSVPTPPPPDEPGPGPSPGPGPGYGGPAPGPGYAPGPGPGFDYGYAPFGGPPGQGPGPEPMRLGGRWRRLFAGLLDMLVIGLISSPFTYQTVTTVTNPAGGVSIEVPYTQTLLVSLIGFLYYWLLTAFWNGQTLGKKVFRLRVVDVAGGRAGVAQAALRQLVAWVMYATCCLGWIDLAFILFQPRKQAVHDLAARTLVVDA
ncbi:hypothetical protein GCM10010517_20220 [Streptosporangium fragile]|uniref:RDD domain-containing protein n=1 Tax=Streptosporangium fragile TaxID=46186 RepID=A0ABN3VUJ2_9ACTN